MSSEPSPEQKGAEMARRNDEFRRVGPHDVLENLLHDQARQYGEDPMSSTCRSVLTILLASEY